MMNAEPDGSRINREGGPLHTEKLADEVVRHKYFAGIALDGDADRCVLVDEKGNLLDGDKMLAALIYDRKEKDDLPAVWWRWMPPPTWGCPGFAKAWGSAPSP